MSGTLALVDNRERGDLLRQRRERMNLSVHALARHSGVDRKTINKAEAGADSVTDRTFRVLEKSLDEIYAQDTADDAADDPGSDIVEFDVSGDFGVHVVVKGPVRDREELADTVAKLINRIGNRPAE